MPIEKLRPSFTFTEDRLKELAAVVPEAFADGKIDWDTLQEALGEYLEDEEQEHFGLTWPGKREARRLAAMPSKGTLVPQPGEGVNEDNTRNIFIEGDNLEVLKLLQKSYAGRVKLIYIDPPYNTGNDFIYSDDFTEPIETYLRRTGQIGEAGELLTTNTRASGRFHSNWLNMLYPRLLLAKGLLRDDGIIFVSIDDNEIHNLRQIMEEIFGPENFVATIIWQKYFSTKNTARHFSASHEYILAFAKEADIWRPILLPRTEEADSRYSNPDNDPRGPWASGPLQARNYYSKGLYEVVSPIGKPHRPPKGTYWRISEENFQELDKDNRIWWGDDGENVPRQKRFLSEVLQGIVPSTLWKCEDVGHTQDAKEELLNAVMYQNTENVLNTVKPLELLSRVIHLCTDSDGDVILDFFAGSGSTAHAMINKNIDDGVKRQFILVQIPEPLPKPEPNLKTLTDVARERIRFAINAVQDDKAGKLDFTPGQDLGFKCYELNQSNYKSWQPYSGGASQQLETLFNHFETPLVDGWQPQNLLVEILLLQGFPLASSFVPLEDIQSNTIQRFHADSVAHELFVCLDEKVDDETIQQLHLRTEDIFVCLDSALSDEAKIRLADQCNLKVI